MQLLCSPDPSIMARKRNTTVSDRLLWTLVFCCCCLLWLRNTRFIHKWKATLKGGKYPELQNSPTVKSQVFWPLASTLRSQGVNIFQNTINPSWNKEESFPKDTSCPGLLIFYYSVNTNSCLLQSSEKLPWFLFFFIVICHESSFDFKMPKFQGLPRRADMNEKRASWWDCCNKPRHQSQRLPEERCILLVFSWN